MPTDLLDDELLPVSLRRRGRTLGHGLYKLDIAWKLLRVRLERGLLDPDATAWIKRWCEKELQESLPLPIDDAGSALIRWAGTTWQVEHIYCDERGLADGPWLAALMLLQLPALRGFWRRALRSQRFAWMAKVLPHVWAVDTQLLKPGTVIAGLGIASWEDLPKLIAGGRAFEVVSCRDVRSAPVDAATWPGILSAAGDHPYFVREVSVVRPEGRFKASWDHDEAGRIIVAGVTPADDGGSA